MSIYTKTGDKGKTSLFEPNPTKGKRVSKSSLRIEAIGSIDEANSYLGVVLCFCTDSHTANFIKDIQRDLFQIGGILSEAPLSLDTFAITKLEKEIDGLEEKLPPLRNFVLPQGTQTATHCMFARSLVRRAERRVVALSKKEMVQTDILKYINRLSDYLFMVFRDQNVAGEVKETIWIGKSSSQE